MLHAKIFFFCFVLKVYKTPFQRISYQIYEYKGVTSALEVFPLSPILQDIFQSTTTYHTNFDVMCEVSIFHIYHKNAIERVYVGDPSASLSPNLLNWEEATHPLRNSSMPLLIKNSILANHLNQIIFAILLILRVMHQKRIIFL